MAARMSPLLAFVAVVSLLALPISLGQLTISVSRQSVIDFRDIKFGQFQIRTISLAPGDTYIIRCEVGNIGTFSQHPWTKDGINVAMMIFDDVNGSNNPQVFYDDTKSAYRDLYLYKFNSALSGEYTCHRNEESKTVAITASNPSITLEQIYFEERDQRSGEITVPFILFGNPVPDKNNISWFFNGSPLDENALKITNLYSTTKSYIFAISQFEREQSGLYTAVVNTSAGTSNDSFILQVLSSPDVSFTSDCNCLSNGEITVSSNSNFTLSCIDTNSNPPPTFTWFKDGEQDPQDLLLTSNHITIQSVSSTESRLIFNNILPEHAGMYYCKSNNTEQRDTKSVTVNVKFTPLVSAITPPSIAVPVGQQMQLLVEYRGGFPEPEITWSHHNGVDNVTVSENDRTEQHGLFGINLTISDVSVSDEGTYTLEVSNCEGTVVLEFDVTILVPPNLIRLSSLTTYGPLGGSATFMVGMVNAHPNVTEDELEWSGNFVPSTQKGTFENEVAVLELTNLKLSDSGNVTLTVRHQGGTVQLVCKLIVLSQPDAPSSIHVRLNGSCLLDVSWEISDPQSMTASTDEVKLEQRTCSYDDTTCVKEWRHLMVYPSDINSTRVFLSPNSDYSLRMTGCSDLVGCGSPEIVQQKVNTNVQDFTPKVIDLRVAPFNSSAIDVSWKRPTQENSCYLLVNYTVACRNTNKRRQGPPVMVPSNGTHSHSVMFTSLESDSGYNCTVAPVYTDLLGNVARIGLSSTAYDIGNTYPSVPRVNINRIEVETDSNGESVTEGTATLELRGFRTSFSPEDFSHVHIAVQRLGSLQDIPPESPDEMYHSLSDFSTYEIIHLQDNNQGSYAPYIAAELDIDDVPDRFIVGSDNIGGRRRQQEYTNGPLNTEGRYTVFLRAYVKSQYGKQYHSFLSTSFVEPFQPSSGMGSSNGNESSGGTNAGAIAVSVVVVLLVLGVAAAVIISVLVFYKVRKGRDKTLSSSQNGSELGPQNEYLYMEEVKGFSQSPPPELPSTDPPKKKPLCVTNPAIDSDGEKGLSSDDEGKKSPSEKLPSTPSSRGQTPTPHPVIHLDKKFDSKPVEREEFQNHLDSLDSNNQQQFEKEFRAIEMFSRQHPAEASNRAHMHGKNRYKNITAFDRTRVCLTEIEDVPNSDYINANYIKGYDSNKSYIATQGPTEETYVDFWRMVWEQNSATIVMLTNLEEKGKLKCFKYWPSPEEEQRAYGNIVVRVDRDIVLPHYTIRSFKLINAVCDQGERTVIQFHYTAWPDKNVPALASPVLDFLRAINSANNPDRHGPMVVHCSAGVGRTGTIIALDICLEQMTVEGRVDVLSVVSFLREQRTQMVQTQSQYIFIHHAILEDIVYGDSTVLLKNFPEKYLKLQASHCALIEEEYGKIAMVRPPAQANTGPNKIPLGAEEGTEMDRFSAFNVDGYWFKNLFVVCSCPASDNLEVFWTLVWQKKCSYVINISQKTPKLFIYLPDSGKEMIIGDDLKVEVEKMEYKTGYILRTITISKEQNSEMLTIKHIQYEDWLSKQLPRVDKMIKFVSECMREVNSVGRDGRPILIHDNGTWSQVGLLVSLLNCFERVRKERLVDLLQAINYLHLQCPTAVQSLDLKDYAYCYDCLHEFCGRLLRENSEPPIYENIASFRGRLVPSPEPVVEKLLEDYDILEEC